MGLLLCLKPARSYSAIVHSKALLSVLALGGLSMGCGGGGGGGQVQPDGAVADAAPPDAERVCNIQDLTNGVSTLAGCELAGAADGSRTVARFRNPVNVAVGPDGRIYVADFENNLIRRVTPAGDVTTLVRQA